METKDLFSGHSNIYATFRPTYPEALYQFIFQFLTSRENAWDCGTGNGQVAQRLASEFVSVHATDLSKKQLEHAIHANNIYYSVSSAEHTVFKDSTFDLITVAQALHWFDVNVFFKEATRVARNHAIVAVWGYGHIAINDKLDELIKHLYSDTVGKYWDAARKHVENGYEEIPFPFDPVPAPAFAIKAEWSFDHLKGYLESWSATQAFINENKFNPVSQIEGTLRERWGASEKLPITFPLFVKVGRVIK